MLQPTPQQQPLRGHTCIMFTTLTTVPARQVIVQCQRDSQTHKACKLLLCLTGDVTTQITGEAPVAPTVSLPSHQCPNTTSSRMIVPLLMISSPATALGYKIKATRPDNKLELYLLTDTSVQAGILIHTLSKSAIFNLEHPRTVSQDSIVLTVAEHLQHNLRPVPATNIVSQYSHAGTVDTPLVPHKLDLYLAVNPRLVHVGHQSNSGHDMMS
jgi:hypothetical protein